MTFGVFIKEWPSQPDYYIVQVLGRSITLGCVAKTVQGTMIFRDYMPYHSLSDGDSAKADKTINDFVVVLNIKLKLTA